MRVYAVLPNSMIERPRYLNKLISKQRNGLVKVISGNRRCGKSYLLSVIFHQYLNSIGVPDDQIIELALDEALNAKYRNPFELDAYIRERTKDTSKQYYVILDEIQKVEPVPNPYLPGKKAEVSFVDTVLGLMKLKNVDLYISGSNSKLLSTDIVTEFRDRGDEIRLYPLSYSEFYSAYPGDKARAWREYCMYGGMPLVTTKNTPEEKSKYLKDLFTGTYIKDVLERHDIRKDSDNLDELLNVVSSSVGSLTNPVRIANYFDSAKHKKIDSQTISAYLDYLCDAFLIDKSMRYDIKGKKYINSPFKYYFVDVGLMNARLNFRQQEEPHVMENIIYNELKIRGFNVDVGVVDLNYKDTSGISRRSQLEVDFVATLGSRKFYIQSCLSIADPATRQRETNSLCRIDDSFKKIVVVRDNIEPWQDEQGILYVGVESFLLDEKYLG